MSDQNMKEGFSSNCGYIPRRQRGGVYVDVEASTEWKKICPAFVIYKDSNIDILRAMPKISTV